MLGLGRYSLKLLRDAPGIPSIPIVETNERLLVPIPISNKLIFVFYQ